ncbi:MAG: dihydroorotate dehydrogenase electron transfer subunit [Archaeoglobaceae archaeon]|nr:dihydroorotate dehydrogenase electron transfer subunit [Archaeoglobaceae archaeon]MDW7989365.1 dihydroorotate dehydrogenase electron transfer subunit [Archaeoglobaceae archaeon]
MFVRVAKVEKHSKDIATIHINARFNALPGQFAMLYVPEYEEIPISFSSESSFTVKAVGETTRALLDTKRGSLIGVRGPFGRPFRLKNNALLIAGGIGIAPLRFLSYRLLRKGYNFQVVYGAKNAEELIWKDFYNAVYITENGTYGIKGTAVDFVEKESLERYSAIYSCGKSEFLKKLYRIFEEKSKSKFIEFSLERYIRCGIGVCGSCVLENGMRVCKDGPVFNMNELTIDDL